MEAHLDFAVMLAQRAGELLCEYARRGRTAGKLKPDNTLVTEADLAADREIRRLISESYPHDGILSEELQPRYEHEADAVWVIDPLDGTTNFSLGLQFWGVSVARVSDGAPSVAALYFPVVDELFAAAAGGGATLNGRPTRATPPDPEHPLGFLTCCSRALRLYHLNLPLKPRVLGSAAYSLCSVAHGTAAVSFEATARIWDIAAATLVVREAGGTVETFSGEEPFPLQAGLDYSRRSYPTIAAASAELAASAREGITAK